MHRKIMEASITVAEVVDVERTVDELCNFVVETVGGPGQRSIKRMR